jgi:heat shock protein HtpX
MKQILKSTILLSLLAGILIGAGYILGGRSGAYIAFGISVLMNVGAYWFSDSIVLKMQRAVPLDANTYPHVVAMVQDLAQKDNLPMPKVYLVDTPVPNAFATGRSPKHAVVAVTSGIMNLLSQSELKSVLAHELGHIRNRDILISSIAATAAGAISLLAELAFWGGALFGGSDDDAPNPLATLAMVILAPISATLIQLAISRSREYLADEYGARLIGHGMELASALQKLEDFKGGYKIKGDAFQQSTAHMMFINMFNVGALASLFSTHPSTKDRVSRLKNL